jgi:hypothetical protein
MDHRAVLFARRYIVSRRAHPVIWLLADLVIGVLLATLGWAVGMGRTATGAFIVVFAICIVAAAAARRAAINRRQGL